MSEKDSLSITNEKLDLSDILEPITVIRLDVDSEKDLLDNAIKGIRNFFNKDYDDPPLKENEIPIVHPVPYCYDPVNQNDFSDNVNMISRTLSSVIELAKNFRQELYIRPEQDKPYFEVPKPIEVKEPDKPQKESRFSFAKKPFQKLKSDPNSPLAKMEKSIKALEFIQQSLWKEALAWHEVIVSDAKLVKMGFIGIDTKNGMIVESSSWIAIFGYTIVPNVLQAFDYGAKLRLKDAERYAIEIGVARQRQEEKDKQSKFTPNLK